MNIVKKSNVFSNGSYRTALGIIMLITCAPFAVSASSEDLIAQLYASLNTKVTSSPLGSGSTTPVVVATGTTAQSAQSAQPVVPPLGSPTTAVPPPSSDQILMPSHLFNVEGNAPKADPHIDTMKSLLAALVAQYALLSSKAATTSASTTSAASSTPPEPKKLFLRNLDIGARGEDVKRLQNILLARGFLFGDITGYFGILTKTAMLAFQADQGLPSVGNVGPRTRALLNTLPPVVPGETPQPIFAPPAKPLTAFSTSSTNASSTAGTSTAQTGSSTPETVWGPPVSISMSILPPEAPIGGSVAITWLSQNADTCVASDGWDGSKPTIGAARIEPLQFSLNLVLTCTGAGGIASTSALVVVGGEQ